MTARHSADTTALAPGLRYSGRDPRGWHVFIVDAQLSEDGNGDSPRKIFRVVLAEKVLQLVQQEVEMTVYVIPEPSGADEWVIWDEVWKVCSPRNKCCHRHHRHATCMLLPS